MTIALPMWSEFFPRNNEELECSVQEVERRVLACFPDAMVDWARGDEYVAQSLQKLIDLGTPEVIYRGHKSYFGRTIYIEIPIAGFPEHRFHTFCVVGFSHDGIFCFEATPFNLDLLKIGSRLIADAMNLDFQLEYHKNCGGLEIVCSDSQDSPMAMARAHFPSEYYGEIRLTELDSWSEFLATAVREWLRQESAKHVIDEWLDGFESPDAFVSAVVREVGEIGAANRAWRINMADSPDHRVMIIDQEPWKTFVEIL